MKSLKEFRSQINEVLKASDPIEKWIDDFVHSKNPKFAGKSTKERIEMAKGAYYGAQKNESASISQNTEVKPVMHEDHLVHVTDGSGYDDTPHPKDIEHIKTGAMHTGGQWHGHSDKGAFFKFKSKEDAEQFKRHVDKCPHKSCYADHVNEAVEYKGIGTDVVDKKKVLNPPIPLTQKKKEVKDFKEEAEELDEGDSGLAAKAKKSGVSLSTLKTVYKRGVAAWNSGHRPGTTPQQWGMARVNSYITKGKGTYGGADKDLHEDARLDKKEYHKGMSDSTAKARVAHWKKADKMSDSNPKAYEPAPGDKTAKTTPSVHTKKYHAMYGEAKVYDPITKKMVASKPIKVQAGGGATRNGVPVETGPSKYKQSLKKEEVEQIDELSKTTLQSYRDKAAKDVGRAYAIHQDPYKKTDKDDMRKLSNRVKGDERAEIGLKKEAVDVWSVKNTKTGQVYHSSSKYPITKNSPTLKKIKDAGGDHVYAAIHKNGKLVEEIEHIDEDIAGSNWKGGHLEGRNTKYANKEIDAITAHKKNAEEAKKKGDMLAYHRHMENHHADATYFHRHVDDSEHFADPEEHGSYHGHARAELYHMHKADRLEKKKDVKEDVQIDEISKSTLVSYIDKASQDVHDKAMAAGSHHAGKSYKDFMANYAKSGKRQAGITKAAVKLAKEETVDEAIANPLPVQHAVNAVHKTLGSQAATRFLGHLKPGTDKHTTWDKVNDALVKQGVQTHHIASIAQKTSHENVNESRGHKVLATFFKNREVAQRAYQGNPAKDAEVVQGGGTPADQGIAAAKKDAEKLKKESVNPALMAILKKRQEAQKKKEEDKKKVNEATAGVSAKAPHVADPKTTKTTRKEYGKHASIPGTKRVARALPDNNEVGGGEGNQIKEDQYAADYKIKYYVDPITGENKTRKIRPHRVNFANSKMRAEPAQADARGDYGSWKEEV